VSWPEQVWSVPILRGLDARARDEIEAAGALRSFDRGAAVYDVGAPADAFFVVVDGHAVVRAVRRGDDGATVIRHARPGEAFGEEASLRPGGVRQLEATCEERSRLVEVPVVVYERALGRSGEGEVAARLRRTLRRAATRDLLRTLSFTRDLSDADLEIVLDAVEHRTFARGERVFREGEPANDLLLVVDGTIRLQEDDDGRPRIRAYLSRGDVVDESDPDARRRTADAVAAGASWLVAIPRRTVAEIAARNKGLLERVRRIRSVQDDAHRAVVAHAKTTRHVLQDFYRLQVARSLLVIDDAACVRCGLCAWSCADAHDDGISRLVRRGDKVVSLLEGGGRAALLVPSSCQHCSHPACMIDCPTGAIGRDPKGEVFIRPELCTGCGSCAKACPWDNIQIAPRVPPKVGLSADVAVKCDLCKERPAGPACVASCPTQAIARIDPSEVMADVRALVGAKAPPRVVPRPWAVWPWIAGAALAGSGLATLPAGWGSGIAAGVCTVALVAYGAVRRRVARWARAPAPKEGPVHTSRLRPWYAAHLGLGAAAMGLGAAHAGLRVAPNLAGALALVFWLTAASGILGGAAYALLPRVLSRLERAGALPEDLRALGRSLDERLFRELSGRSELVKTVFARLLRPYHESRFGALALALSGRTLAEERDRLRKRVDAILGGRGEERLQGLDETIRLVVDGRALRAQRVLQAALRAWLAPHVACAAVVVVLLVAHVIVVARAR
jgi:Fe-S-cluster-containing dehydrogenase component